MAALTCKKAGDIQQAKQFLAVSKVKERKKLSYNQSKSFLLLSKNGFATCI